ncbi:MAG: DUF1566 domain-containing protein [Thermodesulfobacteriota bacterium]
MKLNRKLTLIPAIFLLLITPTVSAGQGNLVKLDSEGRELSDDAKEWSMVKDTKKDIVWEVKTDDSSVHDRDNTYSWKKHKKEFLDKLNEEEFGGFSDWRLPEETELQALVDRDKEAPRIDEKYFPNTASYIYLGWTLCQDGSLNVSKVNFGPKGLKKKGRGSSIRAVRGEYKGD